MSPSVVRKTERWPQPRKLHLVLSCLWALLYILLHTHPLPPLLTGASEPICKVYLIVTFGSRKHEQSLPGQPHCLPEAWLLCLQFSHARSHLNMQVSASAQPLSVPRDGMKGNVLVSLRTVITYFTVLGAWHLKPRHKQVLHFHSSRRSSFLPLPTTGGIHSSSL